MEGDIKNTGRNFISQPLPAAVRYHVTRFSSVREYLEYVENDYMWVKVLLELLGTGVILEKAELSKCVAFIKKVQLNT